MSFSMGKITSVRMCFIAVGKGGAACTAVKLSFTPVTVLTESFKNSFCEGLVIIEHLKKIP